MGLSFWLSKNKPENLVNLFKESQSDSERTKIVDRLIELDAEKELNQLIKTEYKDKILDFYFTKYRYDRSVLMKMFYESSAKIKRDIFNRFKMITAEEEMWEFVETEFRTEALDLLIELNNENPENLVKLYPITKNSADRQRIVTYLAEQNEINLLFGNGNPMDVVLNIVFNRNLSINEFFTVLGDILAFCFSSDFLAKYYFIRLRKRERLFLLLYHYGIHEFYDLPEVKLNFKYVALYYYNLNSCAKEGILELTDKFEEIMQKGIDERDEKLLILAFLIDRDKYKEKTTSITQEFNLVDNMEKAKSSIVQKYATQMREVESKSDIKELIKKRDYELNRMFLKSTYTLLFEIEAKRVDFVDMTKPPIELPPVRSFTGEQLDIRNFDMSKKIVKDYWENIDKIDEELDMKLLNVSDVNQIMKMKEEAKIAKNNLINRGDFAYSVQHLSNDDLDDPEVIKILGSILSDHPDNETKKVILNASIKSKSIKWLEHIYKLFPNIDDRLINFVIASITIKYKADNLSYILSLFKRIKDDRINMSKVLLVSIVEHMHYLLFNAVVGDIATLDQATKDAHFLPKQYQEPYKNFLNNLITKLKTDKEAFSLIK